MARTSARAATPKPLSQAQTAQRQRERRRMTQAAVLVVLLLWCGHRVLLSVIPDDWRERLPPELQKALDNVPWTLPDLPWDVFGFALQSVVGLGVAWVVIGLVRHVCSLLRQRRRPLRWNRSYIRWRVPRETTLKPTDGIVLLRTLHGMVPAGSVRRGDPVPLVLRWTGRPERPIQQGVTLLPDEPTIRSVQKTLEGVCLGADADVRPDPLEAELQPGRVLCWCDVRTALPDWPIAIPGANESPLLDALLPALSPQAGIHASDVQIMLRPVDDSWSLRVRAKLESLRLDTLAPERKVMDIKADGPGYDATIRLVVVADTASAGRAMLRTLQASLASSAQSIVTVKQRLVAGRVRVMPVMGTKVPARPAPLVRGLWWGAGGAIALALSVLPLLHDRLGVPAVQTLLDRVPPVLLHALPAKLLDAILERGPQAVAWCAAALLGSLLPLTWRSWDRWRSGMWRWEQQQRVVHGVMALRNPRTIPLWSDWFGGLPRIYSVAEIATLYHAPTSNQGERVARVMARWIPAPAAAFVSPDAPRALVLGTGQRSDSSWKPIGITLEELRYVLWVTAPMGRGKSEWLLNLFTELMRTNAGGMILDCKSTDLVRKVIPQIPLDREDDAVVINLGGTQVTGEEMHVSMNLVDQGFARSLGLEASNLASTVLNVFTVLDPKFNEAPGMQQFGMMGLLALLSGEPHATFLHLVRFYGDEDYRNEVCRRITNIQVKDFWDRRFPEMPKPQQASLTAFERRLDQLLTFPELSAMLVAPGCSVDLRRLMDNRGIVLAGIRATDGKIAEVTTNLLLTQLTLAALSRSNVPEEARADWPCIIDEAQIPFGNNPGMALVMFSQLRGFHIGQVVVHQNLKQLSQVMDTLANNAQNRAILGAEYLDAQTYGSQYATMGTNSGDFVYMPRYEMQYVKLYQSGGEMFSSRMRPLARPLNEAPPPLVDGDWRAVRAPARTGQDQRLDDIINEVQAIADADRQQALIKLARLDDSTFAGYCARTKEHRLAQKAFIADNPGCITPNPALADDPEKQFADQKTRRVMIRSALRDGLPRSETEALQYRLLEAARAAAQARASRDMAAGGYKRSKQGAAPAPQAQPVVAPAALPLVDGEAVGPGLLEGALGVLWQAPTMAPVGSAKIHDVDGAGGSAPMASTPPSAPSPPPVAPTYEDLYAARGARRANHDVGSGWEDVL